MTMVIDAQVDQLYTTHAVIPRLHDKANMKQT